MDCRGDDARRGNPYVVAASYACRLVPWLPSFGAFRVGARGVGNRNDPYITAAVATSAGARSSAVSWCRAGSYSYRPRPLRYVERLSSGGGNRNYPYIVTAPVSAWRTVVAVWRPMAHAAGVAQRGRSE